MGAIVPAKSLEEIFSFEQNIEDGFKGILIAAGFDTFSSREAREFQSPAVSLWFQNGAVAANDQHAIDAHTQGRFHPFKTYTGVLSTEVITNRITRNFHTEMLGRVRMNLQMFRLAKLWCKYEQINLILDIREGGTVDTFEDENSLDHTTISWNVLHTVNNNAWPVIDIDNPRP